MVYVIFWKIRKKIFSLLKKDLEKFRKIGSPPMGSTMAFDIGLRVLSSHFEPFVRDLGFSNDLGKILKPLL